MFTPRLFKMSDGQITRKCWYLDYGDIQVAVGSKGRAVAKVCVGAGQEDVDEAAFHRLAELGDDRDARWHRHANFGWVLHRTGESRIIRFSLTDKTFVIGTAL